MLKKEEMPACPAAATVALIGSKWKLLIIRKSAQPPLAVQRAEKESGKHQPKKPYRQPAFAGGGRGGCPHGLPGGAAAGGIFPQRAGRTHAAHPGCHGNLWAELSIPGRGR